MADRKVSIDMRLWLDIVSYMYKIERDKNSELTVTERSIIARIDDKMQTIYNRRDYAIKNGLKDDYADE